MNKRQLLAVSLKEGRSKRSCISPSELTFARFFASDFPVPKSFIIASNRLSTKHLPASARVDYASLHRLGPSNLGSKPQQSSDRPKSDGDIGAGEHSLFRHLHHVVSVSHSLWTSPTFYSSCYFLVYLDLLTLHYLPTTLNLRF